MAGAPAATDAIGSYADIVALVPAQAPLLDAIRALVLTLDPKAVEVARPGDRAVSWGLGEKKMSEAYAYAMPFAAHVNVGFYHGAMLADPAGRLAGTGKRLRHVKLKSPADLADPALRALLAAARAERAAALSA